MATDNENEFGQGAGLTGKNHEAHETQDLAREAQESRDKDDLDLDLNVNSDNDVAQTSDEFEMDHIANEHEEQDAFDEAEDATSAERKKPNKTVMYVGYSVIGIVLLVILFLIIGGQNKTMPVEEYPVVQSAPASNTSDFDSYQEVEVVEENTPDVVVTESLIGPEQESEINSIGLDAAAEQVNNIAAGGLDITKTQYQSIMDKLDAIEKKLDSHHNICLDSTSSNNLTDKSDINATKSNSDDRNASKEKAKPKKTKRSPVAKKKAPDSLMIVDRAEAEAKVKDYQKSLAKKAESSTKEVKGKVINQKIADSMLIAVVPGRAFFQYKDGTRGDVEIGDTINGCGIVQKIDAYASTLTTESCFIE